MGSSSAPPPPDYSAMAAAETHAADLGYSLGQQQLALAKQQYSQEFPIAQQVAQSDIAAQDQQTKSALAYYNNWINNAPQSEAAVGTAVDQANAGNAAAYQTLLNDPSVATMTGSDAQVYGANQAQINPMVDKAIADARGLTTQNEGQVMRMGLRYGMAPNAALLSAGSVGIGAASNETAAANNALQTGITNTRGLATTQHNINVQDYGLGVQQRQTAVGNKATVAGLYTGMPSASTGAYNSSTVAGQGAVSGIMAPGTQLLNGSQQGNATTMQGSQQSITGLGDILNAQSNYANTVAQVNAANDSSMGSIAGAAVMGAAYL